MFDHLAFAALLVSARRHRHTIPPPSEEADFGLDDAYLVQGALHRQALVDGWTPRGFKIGFTNRAAWPRLGIDAPFSAPMYTEGVATKPTLVHTDYVSPRVEAEVVLHFATPVRRGASVATIAEAVDWCTVCFEIVESHYPDWVAKPAHLVADYGCHAGLRLGEPVTIDPRELAALHVDLLCDGDLVATGSGTDVLDGPVEAAAAMLSVPDGPTVAADDLVSTGALTGGSHPVKPGQVWELRPHRSEIAPLVLGVEAPGGDRSSE